MDRDPRSDRPGSNLAELSVTELSRALKRTVENAFGYVRVRGEISQPKLHSSGHLYLRLKDETAVIESVCWRGTVSKLSVRAEDGMEVICTGRLTTFPGRSVYQLVIESMELAGEGALLKLLEERKRRLAAEGLFDASRKRPLPFLPAVIGVITSPTGAVIRDILHRLADRFPRHVLLWPVAVQGENAAAQVVAAIRGFNGLAPGGRVPRPDLIIVARGGGSLEDLMAVQRGNRRPRRRGQRYPADFRRRPRNRHDPDRFRLRPPGADSDRRRRNGGAGARRPDSAGVRLPAPAGRVHRPHDPGAAQPGGRAGARSGRSA